MNVCVCMAGVDVNYFHLQMSICFISASLVLWPLQLKVDANTSFPASQSWRLHISVKSLKYRFIVSNCKPLSSQVEHIHFRYILWVNRKPQERTTMLKLSMLNQQSKAVFAPWYCGNRRQLTEWRELSELLMTPACCEVQEDTALTRIHHTDNCKAHSYAHDKAMWPLIGILTAGHIPIFTLSPFLFLLNKSNS